MLNLLFLTDKTTGPGTEAAAAAAGGKSTSGDRPRSAPSLDGVPSRKWRERPVLYKDGDRRCLSERGVGKQPVGLILSLSLSLFRRRTFFFVVDDAGGGRRELSRADSESSTFDAVTSPNSKNLPGIFKKKKTNGIRFQKKTWLSIALETRKGGGFGKGEGWSAK